MSTYKFKNTEQFKEYVENKARQIIEEEKIQNLGTSIDLKMNKMDGAKNSTGAQVNTDGKMKTTAPTQTPKEFKTSVDPVDVDMKERGEGWDEEIATAAKIEGTGSEKSGTETNPHIKGQSKADVTSKKTQPSVSVEADPTKEGGIPASKDNSVDMNKEDKEDKSTKPMTQVLGKGEIGKDGFSKGQTDKEVNTAAKQEKDEYTQKLRDSIKTIQLPESFKNKKQLLEFVRKEAIRISKII